MAPEVELKLDEVLTWDGWPPNTYPDSKIVCSIIAWLVADRAYEGRDATSRLHEDIRARYPKELSYNALRGQLGSISIETRDVARHREPPMPTLTTWKVEGRTTRYIRLLKDAKLPPCPWVNKPAEPEPEPAETPAPDVPALLGPVKPDLVRVPVTDPDLGTADKAVLIMRLAGEIFRETGQADDQAELVAALNHERELRQRAEAAAEGHKRAFDALKRQNAILDANLQAAMKGQRVPDMSGKQALDRLMNSRR